MSSPPPAVLSACRGWFSTPPLSLVALSEGGFSGSPVWLVEAPGTRTGRFVLKAFAADRPLDQARAIHRLVDAARRAGLMEVPPLLPLLPPGVGTIFQDDSGRLWEMAEWRPGLPVPNPKRSQATHALVLLARLHRAIADVPVCDLRRSGDHTAGGHGMSPAWERRRLALEAVAVHGWSGRVSPRHDATAAPLHDAIAEFREAAAIRLERRGGAGLLARLARVPVPTVALQPVLRDVWHAHLLFEGDVVSGLIDFHAAGIDTPAADIARLVGSWGYAAEGHAGARPTAVWSEALAAYESLRPLSPPERRLVDLLVAAGTVGALENWFTWVLDERRRFQSVDAVAGRVGVLVENLDSALDQAESLLGGPD